MVNDTPVDRYVADALLMQPTSLNLNTTCSETTNMVVCFCQKCFKLLFFTNIQTAPFFPLRALLHVSLFFFEDNYFFFQTFCLTWKRQHLLAPKYRKPHLLLEQVIKLLHVKLTLLCIIHSGNNCCKWIFWDSFLSKSLRWSYSLRSIIHSVFLLGW